MSEAWKISLRLDPHTPLPLSQGRYLQFISSGFMAFWIKSSILVATEFVLTLLPSANAGPTDFYIVAVRNMGTYSALESVH